MNLRVHRFVVPKVNSDQSKLGTNQKVSLPAMEIMILVIGISIDISKSSKSNMDHKHNDPQRSVNIEAIFV